MTVAQRPIAQEPFSLRRRNLKGGTEPLANWGFRNETDMLTDVLLGSPAHLRHLATSSLSKKHLREAPCNIQVAQSQHAELVSAYQHFGVKVHMAGPEPELPMQVYTRDSSVMTPYGAIITAMANWWRRGENYAAIRTYEKLGIPIYDMVTAGTFEGGDFNVIEEGCVLIGCGGVSNGAQAYAKIRAGASLVQMYAAFAYAGPVLVPRIKRELAALLRRDGFAHVHEAVGADAR